MKKYIIFIAIFVLAFSQDNSKNEDLKTATQVLCRELEAAVDSLTTTTQNLVRQMNIEVNANQINYKDANKPKAAEVMRLSKEIEKVTKKTQKIYNNRHFIKHCLVRSEEQQYGSIPVTEY